MLFRSEAVDSPWVTRSSVALRSGIGASASGKVSAAERGTAHHAFLQWVDLARTESALDLRNEAHRIQTLDLMREEELAQLDFQALEAFWSSELGRLLREHRKSVHREIPFTARLGVVELRRLGMFGDGDGLQLSDDEFVVVQGQVDLVVLLENETWVIDFKTDAVGEESVMARAREYRTQMLIYAHAMQGIYRKPVTRRVLCFLSARRMIDLSAEMG